MFFSLSWTMIDGDTPQQSDIIHEMQDATKDLIQNGTWELVEKVNISLILENGRADMYTIRRL